MAIRFLVVDDATFIRDMVKKQLRERIPGAQVFDAVDGNRAVAQLKSQQVDVILSDWEMPGMSGAEFLQWVRSKEEFADTPFIMVTSRGDRDHVMKAVQAGVSDYITKPFSSDELVKKVLKQLRKIDKVPDGAAVGRSKGETQGVAFASVDVLTGGAASDVAPSKPAPRPATKSTTAPTTPGKSPKKTMKGKGQLRFASGSYPCIIKDMSLQTMSGLMQRSDPLPQLFDQAVVDIETAEGGEVARVNGILTSMAAADHNPDTQIIKVSVRFVDDDPEKFELLSKYIAENR